jgi:hypothetical protein
VKLRLWQSVGCAITEGVEPCQHPQRKRHAQLRHQPRSTPLWVGDADDWALVRHKPRPPLVCPEPSCDVELISYENLNNKYNPRIFKFKSVNRSCDHWPASGLGGGPESAQHEWMKLRLTRIAKMLGYIATPEHAPTHADVFIHEALYCLEVQLNPTQFRKRTAVRKAKGVKVRWLIREGLDSEKALKALFGLPAASLTVPELTSDLIPRYRVLCGFEPARWTDSNFSKRSSPAAGGGTDPKHLGTRPACGR